MASVDSKNWWTKSEQRVNGSFQDPVISYTACESFLFANKYWFISVRLLCSKHLHFDCSFCPRLSRWSSRLLASPTKGPLTRHIYVYHDNCMYISIYICTIYIYISYLYIYTLYCRCGTYICSIRCIHIIEYLRSCKAIDFAHNMDSQIVKEYSATNPHPTGQIMLQRNVKLSNDKTTITIQQYQ